MNKATSLRRADRLECVMTFKTQGFAKKLTRLLSRYPNEFVVRPESFTGMRDRSPSNGYSATLSFQSVPDKFYFLLFGAICARLHAYVDLRSELIVVRAVNGAMGKGWMAELKRSAFMSRLWSGLCVRAYCSLVDGIAYRCATWVNPIDEMADWIESRHLWQLLQNQAQRGNYALNVDGIEVSDLVISSYLRYKPAPMFNVHDSFVRRLLWQVLRDVRKAHAYFRLIKPRWYMTSYTTYLEHGIPTRVALQQGVEVWSFGNLNCFGKKLTLSDSYQTLDYSQFKKSFENLPGHNERLEEAGRQLETRLAGGIDAATSYMRQSAYGKPDIKLPVDLSGAVVIFLHDFYDSPHVYPDLIFDDFWQWICFTIEVLLVAGINFFIKPHPNQIALSDEALNYLRIRYPDLQWLPAEASNVQLADAGVACGVTVYGTVAHELAYLGVPSIGCARHPHHSFDFCRTARTRDEYAGMLKAYEFMPISKEEMRRQALAFYYMHNLYGDDDQLVLRQAFVALWSDCNLGIQCEKVILNSFRTLVELPAFDRFIRGLVNN